MVSVQKGGPKTVNKSKWQGVRLQVFGGRLSYGPVCSNIYIQLSG